MVAEFNSLDIRPYQLMCLICRSGCLQQTEYCFPTRLDQLQGEIQKNPALPLTLRCNVDSCYAYQSPGREYDTPEGILFNDRRDLCILQRLGQVPGSTRPAIDIFTGVFSEIRSCHDICGSREDCSQGWPGCTFAETGNYERGIEAGITSVLPVRSDGEKAEAKCSSCEDIYAAELLEIRPHHLICMACFYGDGSCFKPIEEDNLYEVIDRIHQEPTIPVKLIAGPCMICPPCSKYCPETNLCVGGSSMGLRDQKKDLDTLQMLGLEYGDVLPADKLFGMLFERISSTTQVCGNGTGRQTSPEWKICGGPDGNQNYLKARTCNLGITE